MTDSISSGTGCMAADPRTDMLSSSIPNPPVVKVRGPGELSHLLRFEPSAIA